MLVDHQVISVTLREPLDLIRSRPLITTTDCYHIKEEVEERWGKWATIYLVLIVVALTIASGVCNLLYYTCYGHPWEAI